MLPARPCIRLDFGYVVHPFAPGNGKKKLSDFVRRRRWVRTRVPTDVYERFASAAAAAAGPTPGASAPGTGPASVAGSANAEAVAAVVALKEAAGAGPFAEAFGLGSGLGPAQEQEEVAGVMEGMLASLGAGEGATAATPLDGGALHADEVVLAARLATAAAQAQAALEQQQWPQAGAEGSGDDGAGAGTHGGRPRLELCSAATLRPRGPLIIEESLPLEPGASDDVTFTPNASLAPPQLAGEDGAAAGPLQRAARATARAVSAAGSGALETTTAAVPDAGHFFGSSCGSGVIMDNPETEQVEESLPATAATLAEVPPAAESASVLPAAEPTTRPVLVRRSAETPPVLGVLALVEKEARKPVYQSD